MSRQAAFAIERFDGPREELLRLFQEADDSRSEIDRYWQLGEVLVARDAGVVIGHVQLIGTGSEWEIQSVAVVDGRRGEGVGAALVRAALDRAFAAGGSQVVVATATADIGNLRFYQRLGFRMERVERDVFTPGRGYGGLEVDGIPVRDRVWFSIAEGERR